MITIKEYALKHGKTETRVRQLIDLGKLQAYSGRNIMLDENTPWPQSLPRGPRPGSKHVRKGVGQAQGPREGVDRSEVMSGDVPAFPPVSTGRNYTP